MKPVHTIGKGSVLCKLPTIGKELPNFPQKVLGFERELEGEWVTTVPP